MNVLARAALPLIAVGCLGIASRTDSFSAPQTLRAPSVESVLADPAWQNAFKATDFFDFTRRAGAPLSTVAYLLHDDRNLYVAFHCAQSGVPIVSAQRTDNAGVASDDHVTVWIDTSGNGSRVYSFSVTPRGVHDETSTENTRYAPPWQSASLHKDGGYDAAMVIPLSSMRSQNDSGEPWRINFERYIAATNEDYTWAYDASQTAVSDPEYWPRLTGITPSRPKPYVDAFALESLGTERISRFTGVDLTYPLTNTLALVGAVNPDFSNVEQDQTTIAPQEFQRSYQEYRPFFSQGAQYINALPLIGFFGAGNSLFYTPSIGVFGRGFKVEGTAGRNSIGFLDVNGPGLADQAAGFSYALPDGSFSASAQAVLAHHPGVNDATTGYSLRQFNPRSGLGATVLANAEIGNTGGSVFAAHSFAVSEDLNTQHFKLKGLYYDIGPGYAPVDGYTAVNDIRGPGAMAEYDGVGSRRSSIQSYLVGIEADRYSDRAGTVHQADSTLYFEIVFKNLISIDSGAGPSELGSQQFNTRVVNLSYKKNTPEPVNLSYSWGPFGGFYVQQIGSNTSRTFGLYGVSLEYDGNIQRSAAGQLPLNTQWLRRIALSRSLGRGGSIALSLRSINGTGGFAAPGTNLSLLYQQRFPSQDLLYLEFGTPAAPQTLHRLILKYVFHAGGAAGS